MLFFPDYLESRGHIKVLIDRKWHPVVDVMYKLIAFGPNRTHRIIHGNFMMCLANEDCRIVFNGFYKWDIEYSTVWSCQ